MKDFFCLFFLLKLWKFEGVSQFVEKLKFAGAKNSAHSPTNNDIHMKCKQFNRYNCIVLLLLKNLKTSIFDLIVC